MVEAILSSFSHSYLTSHYSSYGSQVTDDNDREKKQNSDTEIFDQVISLPPSQRESFVEKACGSDLDQKERILELIQAHQNPDSFLDEAVVEETQQFFSSAGDQVGQQIGPYKLLQELGEGGMGVVYLAERLAPVRQRVALKIIKLGMDSRQFVARFEAERQALALMDHPNIARVLDAGCTDTGRPYFVMELVKGIPITKFCDENKLSTEQRLQLFKSVCLAIHHAHQKGIIHRDIKPNNVLVTLYDDKPVPKVIDFGVAKATNQQLTDKTLFTEVGSIMGTWEYMSPEQAVVNQLDVDTRTDVYSLGVLLYELLTGVTPLDRKRLKKAALEETLRLIREEEPQKPSTRVSGLGKAASLTAAYRQAKPESLAAEFRGDLDWIVMKSLEKERQKRYESAMEFARDVEHYLEHEPVLAGPPTFGYRFKKFLRRNKTSASVGGLISALVAVALVSLVVVFVNRHVRQNAADQDLSLAIEAAAGDLGRAENSTIGDEADWVAARASRQRIIDLLENTDPRQLARNQAQRFLGEFDQANDERMLAVELENVVITCATHDDVQSWTAMEKRLRKLFTDRGMGFDSNTPQEVARKIREHSSTIRLADALDLWVATRGQLGSMTKTPRTRDEMQPWVEAIYEADVDPIRTGIRKIVHLQRPADSDFLEKLIEDVDLQTLEPRTLAWLTIAFIMAQEPVRANQIHRLAIRYYPHDLMLNFDFGLMQQFQGKWEHAIRYYLRCTAIRSDVAGLWRYLGNALRENDELQESRESLEHAVSLQPEYGPIFADLAQTLILQDEFQLAADAAESAIEKKSDKLWLAYKLLGQARMGEKDFDKAIDAFEKFLEMTEGSKVVSKEERDKVTRWLQTCREDSNKTSAND